MSRKGRLKMSRRAQSTIEYAVLIGVMVAALVAMQVYLKRGMQGRLRGYAEQLSQGSAYSPGATASNYTFNRDVIENTLSWTEDDPVDNDNKIDITETRAQINQVTNREERVLSFSEEPRR